ncbi:MAG: DUF2007 domain-containing protein [Candidatus Kapabacteria bacterium]|nr:DUF2007 domain-containing protein [Candidatus Kapabacteria bacterium]
MILLSTFENEMEAQLLASQLREAGVDHKIEEDKTDGFQLFVFEDDLDEAKEILEARASSDDDFIVDLGGDDLDLDDFADV